jgi:hypothetical protein
MTNKRCIEIHSLDNHLHHAARRLSIRRLSLTPNDFTLKHDTSDRNGIDYHTIIEKEQGMVWNTGCRYE